MVKNQFGNLKSLGSDQKSFDESSSMLYSFDDIFSEIKAERSQRLKGFELAVIIRYRFVNCPIAQLPARRSLRALSQEASEGELI